jgi:hypothetical protein
LIDKEAEMMHAQPTILEDAGPDPGLAALRARATRAAGRRTPAFARVSSQGSPSLQRYGRENDLLASAFSREVTGDNVSAGLFNGFVLQIASEYIWRTAGSRPDWGKLDVDGLQRSILQERLRLDPTAAGNFNLVLIAFYGWLAGRDRLGRGCAEGIIRRLRFYSSERACGLALT